MRELRTLSYPRMAPISFGNSPHSAALRENMTRAERTMWFALRDRRLGGHKFRRQVAIRMYIVDFLSPDAGLVVEIDGGQHTTDADAQRSAVITACGFEVIRFWNNDVLRNLEGVLAMLLVRLQQGPSPNPLPGGEGP